MLLVRNPGLMIACVIDYMDQTVMLRQDVQIQRLEPPVSILDMPAEMTPPCIMKRWDVLLIALLLE